MKIAWYILSVLFVTQSAMAVAGRDPRQARSGGSMANQMMGGAPRMAAQQAVNNGAGMIPTTASMTGTAAVAEQVATATTATTEEAKLAVTPEIPKPAPKDMREKEKKACLGGNIGMGNTFVWASRYSNLNNYSSMIEDVEDPSNNTCFVKVEVKSSNPEIAVSDVPSKYFEVGTNVKCGDWANYDTLKQRILDAGKKKRTWAVVGGTAASVGLGVGAMEAFGNRLIGGKVMGQKALEGAELLRSQLAVLKKDSESEYNRFIKDLKELKKVCEDTTIDWGADGKPSECDDYEGVFDLAGGSSKRDD